MPSYITRACFELKKIRTKEFNWLIAETKALEEEGETGWVIRPNMVDITGDPPIIEDIICDVTFTINDGFDMDSLGFLLSKFLDKFRPDDVIGFEWANFAVKPEPGGFSGGAMVVTHENFDVHTTNMWLRPVRDNLLNWIGTRDTPPDLMGYCTPEDDEQCEPGRSE